jgi:hypothetical protein
MATIREALQIARVHWEAGRWELAGQICRTIVEVEPREDMAWFLLGVVTAQRGDHEAALVALGRAIALRPDSSPYYVAFGQSLAAQGRLNEAEACLRQALAYDPDNSVADQFLQGLLTRTMYPLCVPPVRVQAELDFLLLHLPPFDGMLPNGLAYVHNALRRAGVRFQTVDLNILLCHRYYQRMSLGRGPMVTESGYVMPESMWGLDDHSAWEREEVLDFFWGELGDTIEQIARQRPKAVGLSVHATNRVLSKRFVRALRVAAPDVLVVVGGYDCAHRETGPSLFPDFDYMAIFEADLTVGPLVQAIARGERPRDLPGIVSRFDSPDRVWEEAPLLQDLDSIDFPRYQWTNPELYRIMCRPPTNVIPISASRGCAWGRCRFCDECFPFRARAPIKVVDEIEEWTLCGPRTFYFFESDVNGDPARLEALCSEVIRRGLRVFLTAQMRIDKRSTPEYFQHMKRAGFARVRFGVDGWTDHTLELQRKGYNMALVAANLRDCTAAGIVADVNMVVGVPGETEQDIDESIANLIRCRPYINAVEYINPLFLRAGCEYFRNADRYHIRFHVDRDQLLREHGCMLPPELWHSEDPYIDQEVRLRRIERVCAALKANDVPLGRAAAAFTARLREPGAYLHDTAEVRIRPSDRASAG